MKSVIRALKPALPTPSQGPNALRWRRSTPVAQAPLAPACARHCPRAGPIETMGAMRSKILVLLLIALVPAGVLAGCGESDPDS